MCCVSCGGAGRSLRQTHTTAEESVADSGPFREVALEWSRKVNLPVRPSLIALGSGARRREPDRPLFDVSPNRKAPPRALDQRPDNPPAPPAPKRASPPTRPLPTFAASSAPRTTTRMSHVPFAIPVYLQSAAGTRSSENFLLLQHCWRLRSWPPITIGPWLQISPT